MGRIIFQTQTRENARFKLDIHTILLSGKEEQRERNIKGGFLRLITKSSTVLIVFFIQKRIEYLSTSYINIFDAMKLFHVV